MDFFEPECLPLRDLTVTTLRGSIASLTAWIERTKTEVAALRDDLSRILLEPLIVSGAGYSNGMRPDEVKVEQHIERRREALERYEDVLRHLHAELERQLPKEAQAELVDTVTAHNIRATDLAARVRLHYPDAAAMIASLLHEWASLDGDARRLNTLRAASAAANGGRVPDAIPAPVHILGMVAGPTPEGRQPHWPLTMQAVLPAINGMTHGQAYYDARVMRA